MTVDDVLLQKRISIERCIQQIENYMARPSSVAFNEDFLLQDAVTMNIQRACELSIDMANRVIRMQKLGVPKESRESFAILYAAKIIPQPMYQSLVAMVGFRNILVHEYTKLNNDILQAVITKHIYVLLDFATHIMTRAHLTDAHGS
jgi:uncharacterized protein YutE (UPF0331/DUF86 family)